MIDEVIGGSTKVRNLEQIRAFVPKAVATLIAEQRDGGGADGMTNEIVFKVLANCTEWVLKDGQLAYYEPNRGFYVKDFNNVFARKVLSLIEPNITKKKADDLIYRLRYSDFKYYYADEELYTNFEVKLTDKKRFITVGNGLFDTKTQGVVKNENNFVSFTGISTKFKDFSDKDEPSLNGWKLSEWFKELADNDTDTVELFWQVVYAAVNPYIGLRKAIILLGNGRDGKSTFSQFLVNLVGKINTGSLKIADFSKRFALASVENKQLIVGDDNSSVYIEDGSVFNAFVTGDILSVERKGKDAYSAQFNALVVQSANEMPRFSIKSNGTNRRLLIVPFDKSFDDTTDNYAIKEEYIYNDEILEYALWYVLTQVKSFKQFTVPQKSVEALEVFKEDNNPIVSFLNETIEKGSSAFYPASFLWHSYVVWAERNGIRNTMTKRTLLKTVRLSIPKGWEYGTQKLINFKMKNEIMRYFDTNVIKNVTAELEGSISAKGLFKRELLHNFKDKKEEDDFALFLENKVVGSIVSDLKSES